MADILEGRSSAREETQKRDPNIGEMIAGVQHCLTKASFTRQTGTRVSKEQVENVRQIISDLRAIILFLCSLDEDHVQKDIRPVLGNEIFELFLGIHGLRYLLDTNEAFEIIEAERETARVLSSRRKQ